MHTIGFPSLLLALLFVSGCKQPAPQKPADKDGFVDYETNLNDILGKGITPERNANVLLWKSLGPTPEGRSMPAEYFKRLCVPEPPKDGEYFVGLEQYVRDQLKLDRDEWDT